MARRRVKVALLVALLLLPLLVPLGVAWHASSERVLEAGGGVSTLAFTNDGARVAVITKDGLLRAWDAETGALALERRLPVETMAIERFAISPSLDAVALVDSWTG